MAMIGKCLIGIIIILGLVYLFGPKPDFPMYDLRPAYLKKPLDKLDGFIAEEEAKVSDIKTDNESRIIWYGDSIAQTEYSLVYLHGFSAGHEEGDPVHTEFAKRYGMNLYLPRLHDHGRESKDMFKGLTPKDHIASAKDAIAVGALLGKKVILMSCSTGGTYSVMLAPQDPRVHSLIMYSPNVELADPMAKLVTYPWGRQLLKKVIGGEHTNITHYSSEQEKYWSRSYHIDGIVALQSLIDDGMREDLFGTLDIPTYIGCYYKDDENQDNVVSVSAMRDLFKNISTSNDQKVMQEFPDAGRHVFTSHVMVDSFDTVLNETFKFAEEKLNLRQI